MALLQGMKIKEYPSSSLICTFISDQKALDNITGGPHAFAYILSLETPRTHDSMHLNIYVIVHISLAETKQSWFWLTLSL